MNHTVRISTRRGYTLWASLRSQQPVPDKPVIILCHGLGVTSAYPLMRTVADLLVKQGYPVFRFDLAGHGKSGGAVKDRTVKNFVADLGDCVAYLKKQGLAKQGLVCIGYSIGALASLLYASLHPRGIVALVPIACNAEAEKKQKSLLLRGKIKQYRSYGMVGRTKVARNFWSDRNHFEPKAFAKRLRMPTLYMCGTEDHTNPPQESRLLYAWTPARKKAYRLIPGADHYYRLVTQQRAAARSIQVWLAQNTA